MSNSNPSASWISGQSGNIGGLPKHSRGWQKPADRIQTILNTKSVDEIVSVVQDRKAFGKLSGLDGHCYAAIAYGLTKDGVQHMKMVWDRTYGTPEATTKVSMLVADVTNQPPQDDRAQKAQEEANIMLAKLAAVTSTAVQVGEIENVESREGDSGEVKTPSAAPSDSPKPTPALPTILESAPVDKSNGLTIKYKDITQKPQ